LKVCMCWFDD